MKPRILRVLNRFNIGGPTHNAVYLTKFLSDEYETRLIGGVPFRGEAPSFHWAEKHGVQAEMVPWIVREISPVKDLKAIWKLRSIIKTFKPQIIHTHASKAGLTARLAYLSQKKQKSVLVHTFHGNVFSGYFNPLMNKVVLNTERFLARHTDAIIAISNLQKRELVEKFQIAPESKVHVIRLGFLLKDTKPDEQKAKSILQNRYGIPSGKKLIAFVGRVASVKQPELFIEAVAPLIKQNNEFKAIIVGDGPKDYVESLVQKGKKLGVSVGYTADSDIHILGYVEEAMPLYPAFDVVVLTSRNEGTPVTLIEAQAMRVPVVATDVGAVRETVCPLLQDFIVDQNGEGIRDAIIKAMQLKNNPVMEEARQFVISHFDVAELVRKTKELYAELLNRKWQDA
ncbi:MAG: glycosyltransferase family 4 protein [Chlorobi bacterium]|nr:glycosyltransferase family 4 protein [Chlorobiota bacterium]